MLPHLSAGAGQGVEDAFVLARLLGDPRTNTTNLEVSILFINCGSIGKHPNFIGSTLRV